MYERYAYLVYNLALRITCERPSAMAAAERAFLARVGEPESQDALVAGTVESALAAARLRPRPGGAGAAEEEAMLALTAELLDPRERALLALASLRALEPAAAGAELSLEPEAAEQLLVDAYEKLGRARIEPAADAAAGYEGWLWAAPPAALWEGLYPKFYRAAERAVQAPERGAEATQKLAAATRKRRRRPLSGAKFLVALLVPLLLAGGALAFTQLRESKKPTKDSGGKAEALAPATPVEPGGDTGDVAPPPADDAAAAPAGAPKKRKPLTPKQLDKLRRDELRALQLYSMRETDKRLTQAQRDYASEKVRLLRELADRRIAADRRERALARAERRAARKERQLERERQAAQNDKQTLTVVQNDGSGGSTGGSTPKKKSSGGTPQNSTEAQQQCLYNPDNGTYICQQ
jgi:hypothetical protein